MPAETGAQPVRGLRTPHWLEVALALSLVLNVCVAGGFIYSRYEARRDEVPVRVAPGQERPLDRLAEQIGVDTANSAEFQEMRRAFHTAQRTLNQENRAVIAEAWNELTQPDPDLSHLSALTDQLAAHRRVYQTEATEALVKFLKSLTPAQRQTFAKIVSDRANPAAASLRNTLGN